MHAYTKAIEVFEQEAASIRLMHRCAIYAGCTPGIEAIEKRDAELEKCLWAIELLHDAYVAETGLQTVATKREQALQAN